MSTLIYPIRELSTPAPRIPWRVFDRPFLLLWGYLLVVALAEVLTALVSAELGMTLHALLLVGLTIRGASWQLGAERRLAMALTMAPLTRLISLAMPLTNLPQMAWYPIVSVPLLIAAWLIIRQLRVSRAELGLRSGNLPLQLMLMGCGLGLGFVEYHPRASTAHHRVLVEYSRALGRASGCIHRLHRGVDLRGLLQSVATPTLGRWALVYVSLLFAALHIGYLSFLDIVFVFGVGLLFAHIVRWSGSILRRIAGARRDQRDSVSDYALSGAVSDGRSRGYSAMGDLGWDSDHDRRRPHIDPASSLAQPAARTASLTPTNIRVLRRDAGLTYADLAARSGVPARTIAEMSMGYARRRPELPASDRRGAWRHTAVVDTDCCLRYAVIVLL